MPYEAVAEPDPTCVQHTKDLIFGIWNVSELRPHQEIAGIHLIQGKNVVLDVPTGGGKTLAFWWPLLYHWDPNVNAEGTRKILLVVSPLVALMSEQAEDLCNRKIPALALTSHTPDLKQALKDAGQNKFRVLFVSPEMAVGAAFHEHVLKAAPFRDNIIGFIADEFHAIVEWGTPDFRPEYSELIVLLRRLPTGVPVMMGSATLPGILLQDGLRLLAITKYEHIAFSNNKPNVALSVRLMQHPRTTYADLINLFPHDPSPNAQDFPQTLIYVNSLQESEDIQDFLRAHSPKSIPAVSFEFYHRHIAESRKIIIQGALQDGSLRAVSATDALGMGMDFSKVRRVVLWREPKSFLSLVQKTGRCARQIQDRGEMILFITKASYARHLALLEAEGDFDESDPEDDDREEGVDNDDAAEEPLDREAAIGPDELEEEDEVPTTSSTASAGFKAQDSLFLARFIVEPKCRRDPWNEYFQNAKKKVFIPQDPDTRCCDCCDPSQFPVDSIEAVLLPLDKPGRGSKPTPELSLAVVEALQAWRDKIIARDFPNQLNITGKLILSNKVIQSIAARPRAITTPHIFVSSIIWRYGTVQDFRYGLEVVSEISRLLLDHPDLEEQEREAARREKAYQQLTVLASKDYRRRLTALGDECWEAVASVGTGNMVQRGTGVNRRMVLELRCQVFLALPRKTFHPQYYEQIQRPISMSTIKQLTHATTQKGGYSNLSDYVADWRLLFLNARTYNRDESQIFRDAVFLEGVFENAVAAAAVRNNLEMEWKQIQAGKDLEQDNLDLI
ncbi:P-loop containing nucleoside triphosphate hydrolase protein [Roridomyces roridus]|uniref:DNA 3'-5' helicase n=1 Tax=Roridomyces roridus TaxID=1738132 RepID=A0AAD7F8H6_9AGAR|nr:P-loop containing nucleoside triphosphate hydrolase protein [Roridomyces roridus]